MINLALLVDFQSVWRDENMYEQKLKEFFSSLGEYQIMSLATSAEYRVTVRSMSFIIADRKFYCQTDKHFLKYKQILENPQVAISINNIQIEGICKEFGHPLLESNIFFSESYKRYYKDSFKKYTHLKDEVLLEIQPTLISVWNYEDDKAFQEILDFGETSIPKKFLQLFVMSGIFIDFMNQRLLTYLISKFLKHVDELGSEQ